MNRPERDLSIPLLGFVGFSGAGKTTLLQKLIRLLSEAGVRVGLVKHAHHDFDIDYPGKDSYVLRKAGAVQVMVASATREALITEKPAQDPRDPELHRLLQRMDMDGLDLLLVEGFKHERFDKIEVCRAANKKDFLYPGDEHIIALVTDRELPDTPPLPVFGPDQAERIAAFILDHCGLRRPGGADDPTADTAGS